MKSAQLFFAVVFGLAVEIKAEAPNLLTYQGRLKEAGSPVSGPRQVQVYLCDAETVGTCAGTGEQPVAVTNALFRTTFTVPASVNLNTGSWWLEVRLGAGGTTILTPRERLSSAPYAVVATSAATLSAPPGAAGVTVSTPVGIGGPPNQTNSTVLLQLERAGPLNLTFKDTSATANNKFLRWEYAGGPAGYLLLERMTDGYLDDTPYITRWDTFNRRMGINVTAAPATTLEVNGDAQFGSGATKSTFSATGSLVFPAGYAPTAPLEAASKGYVDSQTLAGSGWTRDVPNTQVELSFIVDNVGIGTANPLAKLSVVGNMSVSQPATFGSSVTIQNAAGFGTTGQSSFSNTGVLTLGTPLAIGSGGTGGTTQGTAQTALDVPSRGGTGASGTWGIGISGNAATASALASNPGNCLAGNAPIGVDAAGVAESCFDVATQAELDAHATLTSHVPAGAVMTFDLPACPGGWTEFTAARGRYLVGLPLSGTPAGTAGTALSNLENRAVGQHTHGITDPGHGHSLVTSIISASVGGGTFNTYSSNTGSTIASNTTGISVTATGAVAGTNAPYVQLLVCRKD